MRNFVKLSPNYWVGATGRALRKAGPEAQLVALYLLSSPHTNYIGLYRLPLAYAAADLGMEPELLLQLLAAVTSAGFAGYDAKSETVWVYEAAAFQIGDLAEKDKRTVAAQSEFETLPNDCPYLVDFFATYRKALHLKPRKGMTAKTAPAPAPAPRVETPAPAKGEVRATKKLDGAAMAEALARDTAEVEVQVPQDGDARVWHALRRTLERFLAARGAVGVSEPESDHELAGRILQLAYDGEPDEARLLLVYAHQAEDYTLTNFEDHLAVARAQYSTI